MSNKTIEVESYLAMRRHVVVFHGEDAYRRIGLDDLTADDVIESVSRKVHNGLRIYDKKPVSIDIARDLWEVLNERGYATEVMV
jgi:hypothetical protein